MGIDPTLVSEIVRRVLDVAAPQRIILFGSAATGQMTKDSDIDLLVLESAPDDTRQGGIPGNSGDTILISVWIPDSPY